MKSETAHKYEFQSEVKQVLDIVIHSLYTDKEIFLRELVSNASDALEKLRYLQISEKDIHDENISLQVNITSDDQAGTITIQDFGVGMTEEELVKNLGTIAHSGSKAFLEAVKKEGSKNENLIGQFGVGFYSAFMVADKVDVYTHSWKQDAKSYLWSSDGSGSYTIEETEGQSRGTKIVLKLKEECKQFAEKSQLEGIIKRYSKFVAFPVHLNGDKINTIDALWLKAKNSITEEEYKEFYKFQGMAFGEPLSWLHFSTDAPVDINALLYVPGENTERFGMGKIEQGVSLYCRKVLIDEKPEGLLPSWLRFLRGVIDSADIPLNISRESMQDSALINKIGNVLTKRFIKSLDEMANKEPEKFAKFWADFSLFIKEGITTDYTHKDALVKLLRFESSATEAGKFTSLSEYVTRMPSEQKDIYFLVGSTRQSIETGPYIEAFKKRNLEVLYLFEAADDFVMSHIGQFEDKKLISIDQGDIELNDIEGQNSEDQLSEEQITDLKEWIKESLGEKVSKVTVGKRLIDNPAIALNTDKMMTSNMRRVMKMMNQGSESMPLSVEFQINPKHQLIKNLLNLKSTNADYAKVLVEQLYDNTLISAGLLEDPTVMIGRMNQILERASS